MIKQNNSNLNLPTASFYRRIFAAVLDLATLGFIFTLISSLLHYFNINNYSTKISINSEIMIDDINFETFIKILLDSGLLLHIMLIQIFYYVILVLFFTICTFKFGKTPGKKLLHCLVIDAKTGELPSLKKSFVRSLSIPFSVILGCIGLFMIEFTRKNQALHDKIATTLVVYDKH